MRLAKASLFVLVSFSLLLLVHAGYPECGNLPDFVLYDEHSCTSSCDDCSGNMAGCTTDTQFSQFSRMSGDASAAFEGSEGLLATPTYWHVPFARIYAGRTDFRCYATLEFMIRATVDNKPLFQRLMLSDSAGQGSWVNLEDYVEGGVIDNTKWHKVRIPMADLKSDTYELQSVFIVNFARMMGNGANGCFSETGYYDNPTSIEASCDTPQNFYVDNIILIPGRLVIDVLGYETISERSIALRLKNGLDLEQGKAEIAANPETAFVLVSDDNVSMVPSKIGFSRTAVKAHYTGGQGYAESEWTIHLLYDTPLQANTPYVLSGLQTAGPLNQDSMEVSYNPDSISSSIQVNQLGFVPNRPKHAYVTNWLGDAGGMPVDASTFELVDTSSGTVVHTRELILRSPLDVQTGGDVYDADFSDFVTPGNYQIQIDGIGRSYSFDIHDKVYENAAYKTSRLLYYKRNIPLVEPYVDSGPGWTLARPAINPALDGVFHPILETYPLHNGETALDYRPIAPSWYDAGDYGHYMHNLYHIWPVYNLAFDLAEPQDNVLNIPESGNGIPDLLDELEFGMEFALTMQDSDGGVYWRLCSQFFDQVPPQNVTEPRIIYEKTTRATAQFAGMTAIHARLIRPYNTDRADQVLAAGEKAWEFLQTHESYPAEGTFYQNPTEYSGGGTYSKKTSLPDQLWAAAELFRTTGNATYQDGYETLYSQTTIDPTAAPGGTYMWWAMAMSNHSTVDVVQRERARRGIMWAADHKIENAAAHPYRVPKHVFIQYSGWHSQSGSVINAPALLQAFYLTGNSTYANEAYMTLDMSLGANPLSQSFITGIGHKPVLDPLDRISLDDGVDTPIPGMPSPGFTWHLPSFREPYISVNNAFYPLEGLTDDKYNESYPVLRRYVDSHALIPHNEGTISEAAMYASPLTIMSDGSVPPKVEGSYEWTWKGRTAVLDLTYLPLAEVPLIPLKYIGQWGGRVGQASTEYLNALTPEQVCVIDAPTVPYWVGRMNEDTKAGLCKVQIQNFQTWSLFVALPPSKVKWIPCEAFPTLPWYEIRDAGEEWIAKLSRKQIKCLTTDQITSLGW